MISPAQSRLIAAVEEVSKFLSDERCEEETRRFLSLPARVRPKSPKPADLEEGRQARELGDLLTYSAMGRTR
jgi:hypothetical protein